MIDTDDDDFDFDFDEDESYEPDTMTLEEFEELYGNRSHEENAQT